MVKRIGSPVNNALTVLTNENFIIESTNGLIDVFAPLSVKKGLHIENSLTTILTHNEIKVLLGQAQQCISLTLPLNAFQITISSFHNDTSLQYLFSFTKATNKNSLDRVAQDYLANIIRYSPGFIYLKDTKFRYILCNENFARAAGFHSPEAIKGKTDFELIGRIPKHRYSGKVT